ncbi:MAG: hypothetical protein MUP81_01575 [Dehalococcoidia bacterium]|nr:hypothetical protein [Dehalococcoidia bacterium]
MTIDMTIINAIVALVSGPIISTIIAALKAWLKVSDGKAVILSVVASFGATAFYLLTVAHAFSILNLVVYAAGVFVYSSGYYKQVVK